MSKKNKEQLNVYKVVVMGCKGTGKTSLVNQFVNGCFDLPSHNADDIREYYKLVKVKDNNSSQSPYCIMKIVDLFAIDHEEIENPPTPPVKYNLMKNFLDNKNPDNKAKSGGRVKKHYLKDKKIYAYIFVYDVARPSTLDSLTRFIGRICAEEKKEEDTLITKKFLFANKIDITLDSNSYPHIKQLGALKRMGVEIKTVSAAENLNVIDAFEEVAKRIDADEKFMGFDQDQLQKEGGDEPKKGAKPATDEDSEDESKKKKAYDPNDPNCEDDYEQLKKYPQIESAKASGGCRIF